MRGDGQTLAAATQFAPMPVIHGTGCRSPGLTFVQVENQASGSALADVRGRHVFALS